VCIILEYIYYQLNFPVKKKMSNQDVIVLNVGGFKFTTRPSTLQKFPESRLARMLNGNDPEFKLLNGQYFVDRDGVLFGYILDSLRTLQLALPSDFSDYKRLQREADFYELYSVADLLHQENLLKPKPEILEIRFLLQEMQGFFRIFGSCSITIDELADRITTFAENFVGMSWKSHRVPSQQSLTPLSLERPSHHDLVFQYVSIKPDKRKLFNGANVLGLLIDILLKDGFRLLSSRTVSAEEKVECYCFERMRSPEVFTINITQPKRATTIQPSKQIQMKRSK
ncbi:hypothetical protein E2320_019939, partial [Naja naja]